MYVISGELAIEVSIILILAYDFQEYGAILTAGIFLNNIINISL